MKKQTQKPAKGHKIPIPKRDDGVLSIANENQQPKG
jgi:hypothetical protein